MAALEGEAEFWRQRYLELLQNHNAVIALMAKRDEQLAQAAKLGKLGQALQQRKAQQAEAEPDSSTTPEPRDVPEPEKVPVDPSPLEERRASHAPKAAPGRPASRG